MQKKIVYDIHFGTTQLNYLINRFLFSEEVTMKEHKQSTMGFVEGAVVRCCSTFFKFKKQTSKQAKIKSAIQDKCFWYTIQYYTIQYSLVVFAVIFNPLKPFLMCKSDICMIKTALENLLYTIYSMPSVIWFIVYTFFVSKWPFSIIVKTTTFRLW